MPDSRSREIPECVRRDMEGIAGVRRRAIADSPTAAPPLSALHDLLCDLPERLWRAWDPVGDLRDCHRRLDYGLYSAPGVLVEESVRALKAHLPREAVEVSRPKLEDAVKRVQEWWIGALGQKGIRRVPTSAGQPLVPGRVVASAEPPLPTANAEWDGRVAEVAPGDGGWMVDHEVVVPAVARVFAYRQSPPV